MIKEMIEEIRNCTPLNIDKIEWDVPILNLIGKNWTFSTTSTWRIISKNKMLIGSEDDSSNEILSSLSNEKITKIDFQSKNIIMDPVFVFSNGYILEIFSAHVTEPWTFDLRTKSLFYVASPSDPECVDST